MMRFEVTLFGSRELSRWLKFKLQFISKKKGGTSVE